MAPVNYDRLKELEEFDETKKGVKGIVDSGATEIPRIFVRSPEDLARDYPLANEKTIAKYSIPIIDLRLVNNGQRMEMVDHVRRAAEDVGVFHVVNHGVPISVLKGILNKIREFHELPTEEKMDKYNRDFDKRVRYVSNFDLYKSKTANWRDTLVVTMDNANPINPLDLPEICRDEVIEYSKHVERLSTSLFELLSEALGLSPNYFHDIVGTKELGHAYQCHYYPPCPQPEIAQGLSKHTDPDFITLLIKDHEEGLQILHENQWIDVAPLDEGILINIGDFVQLLSNGKFRSRLHRATALANGPRVTVAVFVGFGNIPKKYGPIKELLSENNPPLYKEVICNEYRGNVFNMGIGRDDHNLDHLKINN